MIRQRHGAPSFSFAVVFARRGTAAGLSFALMVAAAGVMRKRGALSLAGTFVRGRLALVQTAADVQVLLGRRGRTSFLAPQHRAAEQSP